MSSKFRSFQGLADTQSPYRIAAIDLLECFHGRLNASAALPVLRIAMGEDNPWLRLCVAESIWIIEGESPRDIGADAYAVISESAESGWDQVGDRAKSTLRTLEEMGAVN